MWRPEIKQRTKRAATKKHSASTCFSFFSAVFTQSSAEQHNQTYFRENRNSFQYFVIFIVWNTSRNLFSFFFILSSMFPSWKAASALMPLSLCTSLSRSKSTEIMTQHSAGDSPVMSCPDFLFQNPSNYGNVLKNAESLWLKFNWQTCDSASREPTQHDMPCFSFYNFPTYYITWRCAVEKLISLLDLFKKEKEKDSPPTLLFRLHTELFLMRFSSHRL